MACPSPSPSFSLPSSSFFPPCLLSLLLSFFPSSHPPQDLVPLPLFLDQAPDSELKAPSHPTDVSASQAGSWVLGPDSQCLPLWGLTGHTGIPLGQEPVVGERFAQEREETDPCLCLKPQPDSSPGRPACATAPFLLGFLLQSPKMDSAEAQQSSQDSRADLGYPPLQAGTVPAVGGCRAGPLGSDDHLQTGCHGLVLCARPLLQHWRDVSKVSVLLEVRGRLWKPALIF